MSLKDFRGRFWGGDGLAAAAVVEERIHRSCSIRFSLRMMMSGVQLLKPLERLLRLMTAGRGR